MANKTQDPFPTVQYEIMQQCSVLEQKLNSLPAASLDRKKALVKEVSAGVDSVNAQLTMLRGALEAAAADKERFKLTSERLQERQKWLQATSQQVLGLKQRLGVASPTRLQLSAPAVPAGASAVDKNAAYLASQTQAQEQIIAQQDKTLDDISQSLDRILDMGGEMRHQLSENDKELKALEGGVDSAYGKMQQAIGRMKKLLRS